MSNPEIFNKEPDLEVVGVAGVIRDSKENIFFVLENEEKPWKKAGQWSIPMETVEKWESLEQALKRWLYEELWINISNFNLISKSPLLFYVYDSKEDKVIVVKLYVYDIHLTKEQEKIAKKFTNWEIKKVNIFSIWNILNWKVKPLRPWAKEAILVSNWKLEKKEIFIKDWEYFKE